ncbi:SusC/RagA family TonB-linked outer membrane protein [Mariniflexile gromovii]|uniref:SusC/RagA family TonB-linked outer membrane protein n=1 Tax=Mariniflexile gromovii TaxID=362523 RepID=A0ABS4BWN5_9FLAO|nr:SusC/RagA family TonB-linked outer membrane protein [Mariniflexile gromovii]MBP0905000.1 SusC/RagA family TonB-linked outer membrane protein [Mariniflexile gromovii]
MYSKINYFRLKNTVFLILTILLCQLGYSSSKTLIKIGFFNVPVQNTINGKILNEAGIPLPGASILLKGSTSGATTDFDGNFSIQAEIGQTLQISFLGYKTKEIVIDAKVLTIVLEMSTASLDEVLIVGYGSQTKSDVTGALAQLKADDFKQGVNISADNLIQGKIAGVRVVASSGEPGAGLDVSIRGVGSIRSGSTPLFVVDGVPLSNESVSASSPNFGLGNSSAKNPLNFLNTSDIASITVLKDASAAAIYGARGSNGVVIITTKQGKTGDASITLDSYMSVASVIKKIDVLSASEFRNAITDSAYDHGGSTDWQDELFRDAITQNLNFSYSKKTESGNYYTSLSYMDQDGIVESSGFKRTTARLNAEESFFDRKRLKVKVNLTASQINETGIPNGADAGSDGQLIIHSLISNPTQPVFDADGNYNNFNLNQNYNPMYLLHIYDDHTQTLRVLGNIETTFRIVKGLEYKFNYGIDRSVSERNSTIYPNFTDRTQDGAYVQNNLDSESILMEHYLTSNFSFDKNNFEILGGFSYQKFNFSGTSFSISNIDDMGTGVAPEYDPGYSGEQSGVSGYAQENEIQSYFGRFNYNFDNKYLLTASLRADGSTRFGENNKYGYFPSFALGWNLDKESFFNNPDVISQLKLRGSWGQTGNQEVQNKITQASYSQSASGGYYLYDDYNLINGIVVNRTANPDLKWEVVTQLNIGADFSLWNNKLYSSLDYYNKTTTDPILNIPSEPLSPTTTVWKNIDGKIVNKGFEFSLGSEIVKTDNITWSLDLNGATLNNEVQDLPVTELYSGSVAGPGLSGVAANVYKSGYEAGSFFMLKHLGFDENGNDMFEDLNEDTVINSDDRQIFEGALPNFTFGINSNLNYKRWNLNLAFIGQTGGLLVNNTNLALNINNIASDRNVLSEYYYTGASSSNTVQLSTLYLEKSDFIRLNNARLGYSFNTESLNINWLKGLNLYVSAQNVFTITNYSGFDPLVNSPRSSGGNQSIGIDYTTYPSSKSYMIGATLKL